jgi:hypothetical protein
LPDFFEVNIKCAAHVRKPGVVYRCKCYFSGIQYRNDPIRKVFISISEDC